MKILDSATQTAAASYLNQVNPSGSGLYWIGLSDLAQEGLCENSTYIEIFQLLRFYVKSIMPFFQEDIFGMTEQ